MKYFLIKATFFFIVYFSITDTILAENVNYLNSYQTTVTKTPKDSLKSKPLPIYNLFQLSRYLNNNTLSYDEKKELMNLTLFYVGQENVEALYVRGDLPNLSQLYRDIILPEEKIRSIKESIFSSLDIVPEKNVRDKNSNFQLYLDRNYELKLERNNNTIFEINAKTLDSIQLYHDEIKKLEQLITEKEKSLTANIDYNPNAINDLSKILKNNIQIEKDNAYTIKTSKNQENIVKYIDSIRNTSSRHLNKTIYEDLNNQTDSVFLGKYISNLNKLDTAITYYLKYKENEINKILDNTTNNKKDLLEKKYHEITATTRKINDSLKVEFPFLQDTLIKSEIKKIEDNYTLRFIANAKNSIEALKKDIYNLLHEPTLKYLSANTHLDRSLKNSLIEFSTSEKVASTNTQATINLVQELRQNTHSSSIGIPSESQLINSMAIFLANRAKQESVIWFMDQIRNNMNSPLIQDAFPETFNLLLALEDFKIPNFSSGWRNAIAKDFVQLPKNIINSEWVENVIYKDISSTNYHQSLTNLQQLRFAINMLSGIDSLVSNKYGYRDIIRHFYLKNKSYVSSNLQATKIFNALYIITNELFSIDNHNDSPKLRLLTYEELSSLSKEEWKIFTTLLTTKYQKDLQSFNLNLDATNHETWALNIGNVLETLSLFDKLNQEVKQQNQKISHQNFHNVWQSVATVINHFNTISSNKKLFNAPDNTQNKTFKILSAAIGIYDNIYEQDFASAAKNLFSIININNPSPNSIFMHNDFKLELSIDSIQKDKFALRLSKGNNKLMISKNKSLIEFSFGDNILYLTTDQLKQAQALLSTNDKKIKKNLNQIISVIITNSILSHLNSDKDYLKQLTNRRIDLGKVIPQINITEFKNNNSKNQEILLEEITKQINNYSKAIEKDLGLDLQDLFKLSKFAAYKLEPDSIKSELQRKLLDREFETFIPTANETIARLGLGKINDRYINKVVQLVSFFGDVANAKDETDLANVINSHVLPPTSYKLKAKMRNSIDLNAYVGVQTGYLMPTSSNVSYEGSNIFGITAPIGITFSSSTKEKRFFTTMGVQLGIIDLGNLVNHYLFKPNEMYNEKVHFTEVISPSLAFIASIKNSPFAVFASAKGLPLKAMPIYAEAQNTSSSNSTPLRVLNNRIIDAVVISAGFKVDIPLMNLVSKEHQN